MSNNAAANTAEIGTRRSRLTNHSAASRTPKKPLTQSAEEADRMFLTPRVIDAHSYDEMSSNLRALVEQATRLTTQLDSIVERAETTASELKTNAKRYDERLNLGARLFESVCKRAETVEAIAKNIGTQVDHITQFETTINAKHYSFCTGLQTEVDQALANLRLTRGNIEEEVDEHCDKIKKQMTNWEDVAEHLNTRLDHLPDEIKSSSQPTIDEINNLIITVRELIEVNEDEDQQPTDAPTLHQLLRQVDEARLQARTALKDVDKTASRCAAVRDLMGQELMTAVDTMDQLAHENESLRTTIDAAATMANALASQTDLGEKRLQEHCNNHIRTIDRQIQDQTGKLKSMKSEVIGITIELDQRKEVITDLLTEHADEIKAATRTIEYLKRWEQYLAIVDDNTDEIQIPASLKAALEQTKTIVDDEFARIRNRFANLASAFAQPNSGTGVSPVQK